jgi:hypothetical protein
VVACCDFCRERKHLSIGGSTSRRTYRMVPAKPQSADAVRDQHNITASSI